MTFRRLLCRASLLAVAMCQGCGALEQVTTTFPEYFGGRPKAAPIVLNTGHITGFVYGAAGKGQPIPLAFVTSGSVSGFAGNPDASRAIAPEQELEGDNAGKAHLDVLHDFGDGQGPVATDRIIRKTVPPADPLSDDFARARLQYVYLRAGEFFLEGVPEGISELRASFGGVQTSPNPVTVYANQVVTGVTMNLYLPEPVTVANGVARVAEWTALSPEVGISVNAQVKTTKTDEGLRTETTINYKPDPPDVAVTLKAPPGSAGVVIKAVDIIYVYNTPERQGKGQPPVQIGPVRMPIPPVVVAPAQDIAFGPPSVITIPVGSATLRSVFRSDIPDQQPGLIIANMEFIDEAGFAVQDKSFQNLQVSAVLRSL